MLSHIYEIKLHNYDKDIPMKNCKSWNWHTKLNYDVNVMVMK